MSWLNTKHPIVINPDLARHVGLNEAIILQQLNYWIEATESGVEHDGRRWVYNTQEQWREQFPFWSVDTVKRAFASLKKQRLILVKQLAKQKHDRTNYYAIDHARLEEMEAQTRVVTDEGKLHQSKKAKSTARKGLNATDDQGIKPPSNGAECPDLHTETTTETTPEPSAPAASAAEVEPKAVVVAAPPMVIHAGEKRYEIPADMRYPGPDTKSHKTWINYAICYHLKYGTWPLWNATVAGLITQFIARVGADVAPKVAAFYVGLNDAYVLKVGHSVKALLANAEKYHTQYVTGRSMTDTRARQIDQSQSNYDAASEAMALLEQRRAEHATA
ncbi:replication initiation protein [Pseudomonas phage 8P]|nr:replication initiation protein [Pseudomonas phage 8P]